MDRIEELFRELNQEILETRNLAIKSDNSLRNLAADIKQIAKRQEAYEQRFFMNSIGAYVIFAVLSFAGLFLFFQTGLERSKLDRDVVDRERRDFETRLSSLEDDLEKRRQSEREAYEFYEILASGRRDEAVERFPAIQGRLLDRATIELFRREVDRIRNDLAYETYQIGLQHFENQLWQEARDAFTRSMSFVEVTPYSPALQFKLGESLFQLNEFAGAIRYFDLALTSDSLSRDDEVVCNFHRAESLRRSERYLEAIDAYRAFMRKYPLHSWSQTAGGRIVSIQARLAAPETDQ